MSKREYRLARDEFLNEYVKAHGLCTLDELVVVEIAKTCANWGREYNNEENAKAYLEMKKQADMLYEASEDFAYNFEAITECQCCMNNQPFMDEVRKALKTYEEYLSEV